MPKKKQSIPDELLPVLKTIKSTASGGREMYLEIQVSRKVQNYHGLPGVRLVSGLGIEPGDIVDLYVLGKDILLRKRKG
jgi:hypothetical protein